MTAIRAVLSLGPDGLRIEHAPPLTVIGIDPGKSPGLAVWRLDEGVPTCLYASTRYRKPLTPHQQREAFRTALDTCRAIGGVDLCVIESQYQGPSVKTLISLAHDAGQWRAIAELEGVRTLWCSPREWQAHLGLKGLRAVIACELDIALDKLGCHARAADAASACGLALWGLAHPFGCEAEREAAAVERARKKVAKADKKRQPVDSDTAGRFALFMRSIYRGRSG